MVFIAVQDVKKIKRTNSDFLSTGILNSRVLQNEKFSGFAFSGFAIALAVFLT